LEADVSRLWRFNVLGYVLSAPNTLIGLLLVLVFYRPQHWRWSDGCIEVICGKHDDGTTRIWGKPGGQTWGCMIALADWYQASRPDLRVHERVHVVQGQLLGPLFLLAYGLEFVVRWAAGGCGDWRPAYRALIWERWARAVGDRATGWGA
jgi:hypothetical protein